MSLATLTYNDKCRTAKTYSHRIEDKPLVSVCVLTYQHAIYIRNCLDGILMQEVNFSFEIIINDDASTDGTTEIIKEYKNRYPKIIVPLYHKENEYSKGLRGINSRNTFPIARGKYIAICDGDDYWTDPFKLQKQVDFLEVHEDYILVCGGFKVVRQGLEKNIIESTVVPSTQETDNGFSFTLEDSSRTWLTKTLTVLFRNKPEIYPCLASYKYSRDLHLMYHLLKTGNGYYIKEVFGVYSEHEGGISSPKTTVEKLLDHYYIYQELYRKSPDRFTHWKYLEICLHILNYKISFLMKNTKIKTLPLFIKSLRMVRTSRELISFTKSLFPVQIKKVIRRELRLLYK